MTIGSVQQKKNAFFFSLSLFKFKMKKLSQLSQIPHAHQSRWRPILRFKLIGEHSFCIEARFSQIQFGVRIE